MDGSATSSRRLLPVGVKTTLVFVTLNGRFVGLTPDLGSNFGWSLTFREERSERCGRRISAGKIDNFTNGSGASRVKGLTMGAKAMAGDAALTDDTETPEIGLLADDEALLTDELIAYGGKIRTAVASLSAGSLMEYEGDEL